MNTVWIVIFTIDDYNRSTYDHIKVYCSEDSAKAECEKWNNELKDLGKFHSYEWEWDDMDPSWNRNCNFDTGKPVLYHMGNKLDNYRGARYVVEGPFPIEEPSK